MSGLPGRTEAAVPALRPPVNTKIHILDKHRGRSRAGAGAQGVRAARPDKAARRRIRKGLEEQAAKAGGDAAQLREELFGQDDTGVFRLAPSTTQAPGHPTATPNTLTPDP